MINLCIGLSQNQITSYERLIKEKLFEKGATVLVTNKTIGVQEGLWDKVIYSNNSFNNQSKNGFTAIINIISKIKQYKAIIKKLSVYKKEKNITLYFTYIEDILTNYLLLSFNSNLKGIVVEDGTLNYYPHTIKFLSRKKIILKWFLSNLYNLRFKLYKGHSSGIEYKHVIKQYVRVPELSMFPNKSINLPYPKRTNELKNTILIIGQESYINQEGEQKYIESLLKMFSIIKTKKYYKNISKVYYKPHRNGKRLNLDWLENQFKDINFKYLELDTSLEDLYFDNLGSKYIFTFDSSALLNIFLEHKDKDKIELNVVLSYNKLLEPVFNRFKFKIYK